MEGPVVSSTWWGRLGWETLALGRGMNDDALPWPAPGNVHRRRLKLLALRDLLLQSVQVLTPWGIPLVCLSQGQKSPPCAWQAYLPTQQHARQACFR